MSSILINGMTMPTYEQGDLVLRIRWDGRVDKDYSGNTVATAVPIPPHGRLIDADALADDFRGWIAMYDSCPFSQLSLPDKARRDEMQAALAEVINALTIIPAEEEER